jgi:hypothetical protein
VVGVHVNFLSIFEAGGFDSFVAFHREQLKKLNKKISLQIR